MRRKINLVKEQTPETFKIGFPDMQGPFNLAHAVVGNDALTAPLSDPASFHRLMDRITDFWIAVRKNFLAWIGPARLPVFARYARI